MCVQARHVCVHVCESLHVCMCVCEWPCVCMCTHVQACMPACVRVCTCVGACMSACVCVCVHMCASLHVFMCRCVHHVYVCECTHSRVYVHTCASLHICMCVCVQECCACVCESLHVSMFVCVCFSVPVEVLGIFFNCFSPNFLRQALSLGLELTVSARLPTEPQGSSHHYPAAPVLGPQTHVTCPVVTWVLGICTQSLCLLSKHWATSLSSSPFPGVPTTSQRGQGWASESSKYKTPHVGC